MLTSVRVQAWSESGVRRRASLSLGKVSQSECLSIGLDFGPLSQ
jgi:hypothetical protein